MIDQIVDANAMLGRHPMIDVGDGSVAALLKTMDRFAISRAVVFHSHAWRHEPLTGNRLLLDEVLGEPRLDPCWVAMPDPCGRPDAAVLFAAEARAHGVVAVRMFPRDHGYRWDGPDAEPWLDAVAGAGLPLFIDAEQTSWPEIEQVATRWPKLRIVVCRVGYRVMRAMTGVMERAAGVHVDLSYLSTHAGLEWLIERFGPYRVVFGTGMPERDPADAVTRLMLSELAEDDVAAIAHQSWARLRPPSPDGRPA